MISKEVGGLFKPGVAEEFGEKIRSKFWGNVFPVDPIGVADLFGIQVFTIELPKDIFAGIFKKRGEDPKILLSDKDSKQRKRFSCAHELGHFVFRSLQDSEDVEFEYEDFRNRDSSSGENPEEVWANQFAASFLMPAQEFKKHFSSGFSLFETAEFFGVSSEAVKYRAKNI